MGKVRFGPSQRNPFEKREDLLPMETDETAKEYQAAEQELLKLIEAVEGIEEGDLKAVEETIYQGVFQIGRRLMEGRMNTGKKSEASSS